MVEQMENGMYIFENADDFLIFMEDLQKQYNERNFRFKKLYTLNDIQNEIIFLDKCRIDGFTGKSKTIKVYLTYHNCNYLITYAFNKSESCEVYNKFRDYLQKREWI